jgi:hypothetical protein
LLLDSSETRVGTFGRRRQRFAVRITSYPEVGVFVPVEWNATAAEVTERVRVAMDD